MSGAIYDVVQGGYCVGCGACAVKQQDIAIATTADGRYEAKLPANRDLAALDEICPFSAKTNENDLAADLYANDCDAKDDSIGYFRECFAGHVTADSYRIKGSSGGLITWLACRLLETGRVDAVIHVKPIADKPDGHPYFAFALSNTPDEVRTASKSRYYPIEMSGMMAQVKSDQRRYLFIGIPCYVKALRLLQRQDADLAARIPHTIALVCGHLKTRQFMDYYAYALGEHPRDTATFDFRHKIPANRVNDYGVKLTERDGEILIGENRSIFGTNWGHGFFKNNACDYCDDVLGETADISVGDAWLPAYEREWQGTNAIVVRSKIIHDLMLEAEGQGALHLDRLTKDDIIRSQASGLRHRRLGLSYRLWLKDQLKQWRPVKRVTASDCAKQGKQFQDIQRARLTIARESRLGFIKVRDRATYLIFKLKMIAHVYRHEIAAKGFVKAPVFLLPGSVKTVLRRLKALRKGDRSFW